ncbi:hypothetical protein ACIQUM_35690 [Amycolatopsis azurea]|uniref:hypothetical protein n=1 Tax=Amycolatopsis azurea TaxID=36819 RepID=UPI0037FFC389
MSLVLVSGPPGVGKSATALAAATAAAENFPCGQLFLDLRGSRETPLDAAEALTELLAALGVRHSPAADGVDSCRSLYRSLLAERPTLIVLDDAAGTDQVEPLVPGTGASLVIVTSRRRLAGLETDLTLELGPLSMDDALAMITSAVGKDIVDQDPAAARSIVLSCGLLPSAIRIAAARIAARPVHPTRVLAERLRDPGSLLDELEVDGLSLRAELAPSYRALDRDGQRLFASLGGFDPSHISADAVARRLGVSIPVADRRLEALVSEGLVEPVVDAQGRPGYGMSTVLHAFARECQAEHDTVERS